MPRTRWSSPLRWSSLSRPLLLVAVAFGLYAAVLATSNPTVSNAGESAVCTSLLVDAAGLVQSPTALASGTEYAVSLDAACVSKQHQTMLMVGLAALFCLGFGSAGLMAREDERELEASIA